MRGTSLRWVNLTSRFHRVCAFLLLAALLAGGCSPAPPPIEDPCAGNPANCPKNYLGSQTCLTCHSNFAAWHNLHGHNHALKLIEGEPPDYPPEATLAGVSDPPPGWVWSDIRLVIGGYTKAANYVSNNGFLITDGPGGPPVQYTLPFQVSLDPGGFVPLHSTAVDSTPYGYDCFRCHTTGPRSLADNGGQRQENRPGIEGTWAEAGVQCENCHGPGSAHVENPYAGNIELPNSAAFCGGCHGDPSNPSALPLSGGFPVGTLQWAELLASPHADFSCSVCHETHASVLYGDAGLRNACLNCHADMNMARHGGKVLVLGDYAEILSCQSCHMPPIARNASSMITSQTRIGDTRAHFMGINTTPVGFDSVIAPGGQELEVDAQGKVAMTVDVVCLRCHNGGGSAFALDLTAAAGIAGGIHQPP